MKRLLLLRHAKAVSGGSKIDDHERALSERGRSDAPSLGRYMRKHDFLPDLVLCSSSRRTLETAELAFGEFKSPPEIDILDALYLAEANNLVSAIRELPETKETVCLVGHNPGLENCAWFLAREPVSRKEKDAFDLIEEKFPTGALAVLDFDVRRWRDLEGDSGVLVDFVRPRDL